MHLEFDIPRLGRRADAVLVSGAAIVPIEFKVGATRHERQDWEQAWDYGLDLKNFHAPSHAADIFPILCATEASRTDVRWRAPHADGVRPPFRCNAASLRDAIRLALRAARAGELNPETWGEGNYSPTPTIIEAARALYARHSVHEITRNDAGAVHLAATSAAVESILSDARARRRKAIVFVTGVPGAGKTLVGLNVATRHGRQGDATHAVYLSGNGPLVAVLREALARDDFQRTRVGGATVRIGEARNRVKAFIQNVHHFRDDTLRHGEPPVDHVVVFDEAQRAWNATTLGNFMRRRKGISGIVQSEPELLIGALDRHDDWAVVICLVGGGQEINTGEAGIGAWLDGVRSSYPNWDVHLSPHLRGTECAADESVASLLRSRGEARRGAAAIVFERSLHLDTSMRSFRAAAVSAFVRALLDGDRPASAQLLRDLQRRYPIAVARSMREARRWIQRQRRGSERAGLVASSSAQRLKPHAVDVRVSVDPVHWFLGSPDDTRSSQYLEDAATEFQVQGLEVDWTIVAWDADFRRDGDEWTYHDFRGNRWTDVRQLERRRYLKNAYRVLLTRARQGMVIFIPPGRKRDRTRDPAFYSGAYEYVRSIGVPDVTSGPVA